MTSIAAEASPAVAAAAEAPSSNGAASAAAAAAPSDSAVASGPPCSRCANPAKQLCPTCIELKLPPARFCSQECFKAAWKEHNTNVHKRTTDEALHSRNCALCGVCPLLIFLHLCCSLSSAEKERLAYRPPHFEYTGPLRPAWISPRRTVPPHIVGPDYALTGEPLNEKAMGIHINTPAEIKGIRAACKIGRAALDLAHRHIKPGVTTDEIDRIVHEFIISQDAYPSPLNYRHFPKSLCTSVLLVTRQTHPHSYFAVFCPRPLLFLRFSDEWLPPQAENSHVCR
jgi:methionyl aminopeptidase